MKSAIIRIEEWVPPILCNLSKTRTAPNFFMENTKIKYRKRSRVREHEEAVTSLTPMVVPMPKISELPDIEVKAGRKKKVVETFEDDPRSDKMGIFISQGLSPMEAGILAGFASEELLELQKDSDGYRRFVENELIKLKQHHLKVITDKKDPNTSKWLLEKTFPAEFAQPKTRPDYGEGSNTVIAAIFRTVQREGDSVIPMEYADITSQEEEQGHDAGKNNNEPETSIEPGGANII